MFDKVIHSVMDGQECPKDKHKISDSCLDCSYCFGYNNAFYACRYEGRRDT